MVIRRNLMKLLPFAILAGGLPLVCLALPMSSAGPPQESALGRIELVAGAADPHDGGKAIDAQVVGVAGLAVDAQGNLYFSDSGHNRVRKVDVQTGTIDTVAGNGRLVGEEGGGLARERSLRGPGPLAADLTGQSLYVGEIAGHRIERVDLAHGTIHEMPLPEGGGFSQITALVYTQTGLVAADAERGQIWKLIRSVWVSLVPSDRGQLEGGIRALARDRMGHLYLTSGHRVIKLDTNTGRLTPFAGTGEAGRGDGGPALRAALKTPQGLAFDAEGNLFVADTGNNRIVRID